jgi:hypothetical protein
MDNAVAEIREQLSLGNTPSNLVLLPGERLLTVIGVYYDPNDGGRFFAVTTLGRLYCRYNGMIGAPRSDLTDAHADLIERVGNMIMDSLSRGEDAGERMQLVVDFIAALK